jgi:hypothetical protein
MAAPVDLLPRLGTPKQLATDAATTSNRVALTAGVLRISVTARLADHRIALGGGAVVVSASTSHYLQQGERIEFNVDSTQTYLAAIIAGSVSGVTVGAIEITELA